MAKKTVFTHITPLPAGVNRETVMETLRNHVEMIDLNPLVIDRFRCDPPGHAPEEEMKAIWYQLKDKVEYLPGGLASGDVTYHSCFHDIPNGLQTHVYAPLGLEIKGKWTLRGNLPGEPPERHELGVNAPREGLYLREDVEMKCNILMTPFVKKTLKKAHSKLVEKMMENSKIRATNAHILGLDQARVSQSTSASTSESAIANTNRNMGPRNVNNPPLGFTNQASNHNSSNAQLATRSGPYEPATPLPRFYGDGRPWEDQEPNHASSQFSNATQGHAQDHAQGHLPSRNQRSNHPNHNNAVSAGYAGSNHQTLQSNAPVELPATITIEPAELPS